MTPIRKTDFIYQPPWIWLVFRHQRDHQKRMQLSRKYDEIIAYISFICGFSAIISRLDSKDFSDTQPNERQEKFSFCFPFVTNSLPKPDFYLLTLFLHLWYNEAMKRKAVQFTTETLGAPKLENIPKDILDDLINSLELVISELCYNLSQNCNQNIQVNPGM